MGKRTNDKTKKDTKEKGGVWRSIKLFAPYFKPYKGVLIFDLVCALLASLSELIFPRMVGVITGQYFPQGLLQPILMIGLLLIVLKSIEVLCRFFMTKYGHIMGANIETDLRTKLFSHLESMSHKYYDNVKVGSLMSRLTTDLFDITEFAHHCPEEFFIAAVKVIGSLVLLLVFHSEYWILTLTLFVMMPIMIVFAVKYNIKMRNVFKENRVLMGEINAQAEDSLSGIRVVKSFTNEGLEAEKFDKGNKAILGIKKKNYHYMATFNGGMKFFDAVSYVTIIILGSVLRLDAAAMIEYLLYSTALMTTVRTIAEYAEASQRGITAFERYQDVIETPVELTDKENAIVLSDVRGNIRLDHVYFRYSQDTDYVLKDISLCADKGETVAIVGPSGSGKSTIANLIPRFYDILDGIITIDGKDIRDVTMESLRKNIGIVQQDVYLFWGTVADNIAYGKPGTTFEEIERAAKLAGADEFINKLPDGYNSYVGERGVKLSGGQKQRISIARVFLKNPPVLILDEATSSLDNESEKLVQESLDKLAKGRTSIVIAHRLSTVRNASKIIVLTEKGIVETGTHEQLISNDGLYKKLYELSTRTERIAY